MRPRDRRGVGAGRCEARRAGRAGLLAGQQRGPQPYGTAGLPGRPLHLAEWK